MFFLMHKHYNNSHSNRDRPTQIFCMQMLLPTDVDLNITHSTWDAANLSVKAEVFEEFCKDSLLNYMHSIS
jgi:hypothetical protein